MRYRIGIDIGTTNTKAVLYDEALTPVAASSATYKTYHEQLGFAEQDPDEVLQAFKQVLGEVLATVSTAGDSVELLAFSGAMHSLILVDGEGRPLTRSIIWSDNRAVAEVEAFKATADWLAHYRRTGTPVHSMSPFFKLLWLKRHTTLLDEAARCIGIKDYILHYLCGEYVCDYSLASATGLFNLRELAWDREALDYLEISSDLLPVPVDGDTRIPVRNRDFLQQLGLPRDLQIVPGASDGCLANLGGFALGDRETTVTIGTSGAVRMTVAEPLFDPEGKTFCYYLTRGKWVIGGAINNGGNVLQWLDGILYGGEGQIYEALEASASQITIGSDGLLFVPYLFGERAPHWDGRLRASFQGLNAFHTKAHLLRAAVEGLLYNLREVWERLQSLAGKSTKVIASGGFLRSPVWTGMMADIFGVDLYGADEQDSSCLGAVLLAGAGGESVEAPELRVIQASVERQAAYSECYQKYLWYTRKLVALQAEARERFGE
ncbi:MAG: gluconokinase [Clostridia bacterium]|nr:gluconokinase [Clostridia bacterium]